MVCGPDSELQAQLAETLLHGRAGKTANVQQLLHGAGNGIACVPQQRIVHQVFEAQLQVPTRNLQPVRQAFHADIGLVLYIERV